MTEKNNEQQPWEASFKDEATGQYSRTQNRRKSQRVSMVVGILVLIVIALSFVPVYKYLQALNKPVDATTSTELPATTSTKTTTTTSKITETAKSKSESRAKKAASASEKKAKAASQSAAAASSKAASESAASSESSASSSSSESDGNTVKFESGTLYSFAVANGTTPEALYSLNPGLTASNYSSYYGQDLKVK
ncbi:MAG: LysM peptidoglycan-binding domain-containing protein [Weissella confusa]